MQTRRDYLVAKGLAKPGRGKFSTAAKEELARARAAGVKFSDWPETGPETQPTGDSTGIPVVSKPATETPYLLPDEYRFPEALYRAVAKVGGKEYGMRECCNACRVSLVNHTCDNPTIHGTVAVSIVLRKGAVV